MRRGPESGGGGSSRVEAVRAPETQAASKYEFTSVEKELELSKPFYLPDASATWDDVVKNNPWGFTTRLEIIEGLKEQSYEVAAGLKKLKGMETVPLSELEEIKKKIDEELTNREKTSDRKKTPKKSKAKKPAPKPKIEPKAEVKPTKTEQPIETEPQEIAVVESEAKSESEPKLVAEEVIEEVPIEPVEKPVEEPDEEVAEEAKIESMEVVKPGESEESAEKPIEEISTEQTEEESPEETSAPLVDSAENNLALQARLQAAAEGGFDGPLMTEPASEPEPEPDIDEILAGRTPLDAIKHYESEIAKYAEEDQYLQQELAEASDRQYRGVNQLSVPSESPTARYEAALEKNNAKILELRKNISLIKTNYPDWANTKTTDVPKDEETLATSTESESSSKTETAPLPTEPESSATKNEKTLTFEQKLGKFRQDFAERLAEADKFEEYLQKEFAELQASAEIMPLPPEMASAAAEAAELYSDKKTQPAAKPTRTRIEDVSSPKADYNPDGTLKVAGQEVEEQWNALSPAEQAKRRERVSQTVEKYGVEIQSLLAQGKQEEAKKLFQKMRGEFDNNELCHPDKHGGKGYPYGMDRDSLHFCHMLERQLNAKPEDLFHIDVGDPTRQNLELGDHLEFMQEASDYFSDEIAKEYNLTPRQRRKKHREARRFLKENGHYLSAKDPNQYYIEYAETYWQNHRFPGEFPEIDETIEAAKEEFNATATDYTTKILEAVYSRNMLHALELRENYRDYIRRGTIGDRGISRSDYDQDISRYVAVENLILHDNAAGEKAYMKEFGKVEKRGHLPIGSGEECASFIHSTVGTREDYLAAHADEQPDAAEEAYKVQVKNACNEYWAEHQFPTEFLEERPGVKERLEPLILGASATAYQHVHANARSEDEKLNYTESGHDKHAPYISDEIDQILADNGLSDELSPEMEEYLTHMTHFDSMYNDIAFGDESRRDLPVGNLSEVKQMMHETIFNANSVYLMLSKKYGLDPDFSDPEVDKDFRRAQNRYQERIREGINNYWQEHRFPGEFPGSAE